MTKFGARGESSMMPVVNDVIDELHTSLGLPASDFFCECGHIECAERITLTRAEYASVREAELPVLVARHSHRAPGVAKPHGLHVAPRASQEIGDPGGR